MTVVEPPSQLRPVRRRGLGTLRAVGVIAHPTRPCRDVLDAIAGWTERHGARLLALDDQIPIRRRIERVGDGELVDSVDVVIAVGGDGTLLRSLAVAALAGVPVLGVNLGRLGLMAEVDPPELTAALDAIDAGRYRVEERVALETNVRRGTGEQVLRASNDVVLRRVAGHRQAELAVSIGGQLFSRYVGDGLILSTPTGSTAYAYSAGGPIVSPGTQTLLVTPLAAHSLVNRSLIVDAGDRIEIEVLDGSAPLVIERDGSQDGEVTAGSRVTATRSTHDDLLIRLGWTSFYSRARRKLQLVDPLELTEATVTPMPNVGR
jgi:NAD+ kinase